MLALGAAVEAGRIHLMPGGPQPVRHRLPNPAALVRAVDQNKSRHYTISLRFLNVRIAAVPAVTPGTKPLSALQGGEGNLRGHRGKFRWPSIPASYVDRDARHEIGVARGEKADELGLVGGFWDAPQLGAGDFGRLRLL